MQYYKVTKQWELSIISKHFKIDVSNWIDKLFQEGLIYIRFDPNNHSENGWLRQTDAYYKRIYHDYKLSKIPYSKYYKKLCK
jgi:hypothetical protein